MPGNLLHGNLQIPALEGDTQKDIKTILNYLYQLQEQLRYTMRNIGEENFNEDELERLSVKITGGAINSHKSGYTNDNTRTNHRRNRHNAELP